MIIKRIGLENLAELLKWRITVLREVFSISENENLESLIEQNRIYYTRAIPENRHIACFAYDGEKIIGCGGVCLYEEMPSPDNADGKCAYLMNVYVSPEYRGKGTGKSIVLWLTERAKQAGANKIFLETTDKAKGIW